MSDSPPSHYTPAQSKEISVIGVGHFFSRVFHSSRSTTARYVSFIPILLPLAENTFNTPHLISKLLVLHHARVIYIFYRRFGVVFALHVFDYPRIQTICYSDIHPHTVIFHRIETPFPRNFLLSASILFPCSPPHCINKQLFKLQAQRPKFPSYPTVYQIPSPKLRVSVNR